MIDYNPVSRGKGHVEPIWGIQFKKNSCGVAKQRWIAIIDIADFQWLPINFYFRSSIYICILIRRFQSIQKHADSELLKGLLKKLRVTEKILGKKSNSAHT